MRRSTAPFLLLTVVSAATLGQETDARQVFRRLAGCWTYWGWKARYFSSEADALAFYDETCHMLATQVADIRELPDPPLEPPSSSTPTLGPAIADGTGILRLFDPDRFLPTLAPALSGACP